MSSRIRLPHVLNGRDEQLGTWDDTLFTYDTVMVSLKILLFPSLVLIFLKDKIDCIAKHILIFICHRDKVKRT